MCKSVGSQMGSFCFFFFFFVFFCLFFFFVFVFVVNALIIMERN